MVVVGIPKKLVLTIGIFMDHRRKNMPLEVMQSNVQKAQDTRPSWKL